MFANRPEIKNLLNAPSEINFDNTNFKLDMIYTREVRSSQRGCGLFAFACGKAPIRHPEQLHFVLMDQNEINIGEIEKRLQVTDLWIINANPIYYYETKSIKKEIIKDSYSEKYFSTYYINIPPNYNHISDKNIGIIRIELENRVFYIKTTIYNN